MKNNMMKIAILAPAALLGVLAFGGDAAATNLNQHGSICVNKDVNQANTLSQGFTGVSTTSPSGQSVICPLIHSPTPDGSNVATYFVDGTNAPGATTSFTIEALEFNGTFRSAVSFSISDPSYDQFETLPFVTAFSYVSLVATLPPSGRGTLLGVTSMQP